MILDTTPKLETPHLMKTIKRDLKAAIDAGEKNLEEDWINTETKKCNNCKGSGFDYEDGTKCIGCSGTGIDYILEYGVEDKKLVSRITQNGTEAVAELCRLKREEEAADKSIKKWDARLGFQPYLIQKAHQMELTAKYPEVREYLVDGNIRAIAKLVQREYPYLMTTNLII